MRYSAYAHTWGYVYVSLGRERMSLNDPKLREERYAMIAGNWYAAGNNYGLRTKTFFFKRYAMVPQNVVVPDINYVRVYLRDT